MTKIPSIIAALWGVLLVGGQAWMMREAFTPAETVEAIPMWPKETCLAHDSERLTLVMAIHPKCPCSQASLGELHELLTRHRNELRAFVLMIHPDEQAEQWLEGSLQSQAQLLPETTVVQDIGGVEASRFGATISGETLVYAPTRELLFHGGLTPGRGHFGDNVGQDIIGQLVREQATSEDTCTVYGCPLGTSSLSNAQ